RGSEVQILSSRPTLFPAMYRGGSRFFQQIFTIIPPERRRVCLSLSKTGKDENQSRLVGL
ncbi:MAG TPA: hypothetical protein PKV86_11450, partial [Syntrophobacteraceae bacterium]|nr:hypothetical protein [Syntrophobacteraceae bacterium]